MVPGLDPTQVYSTPEVPDPTPTQNANPEPAEGILPNNRGTMMGWIGNSQAIKPNNRMPPYTMLSNEELTALAVYLEAQK